MKEKAIICIQCGNSFVFSISEQERFRAQGFDEPRRCRDCRRKKAKSDPPPDERKKRNKRRQSRQEWDYIPDL